VLAAVSLADTTAAQPHPPKPAHGDWDLSWADRVAHTKHRVIFDSPEIEKVEKEIGRKHHYVTTRHNFQVYGICEQCQKKKPGLRGPR